MNESFPQQIERLEHEPTLPSPEHHKEIAEHAAETSKVNHDPAINLTEARKEVAELAQVESSTEAFKALEEAKNEPEVPTAHQVGDHLQDVTLARGLKRIRQNLSAPERNLSKFVHLPVVRAVSDAAAGTVSRPSGLLGGGLVALLGTSIYLYLAKHIGFSYNYALFLALFAGGFVFGLILELAVYVSLSSRRVHD
jgi:hypothetical protein